MAEESTSPTREAETSEFDLFDSLQEEELKELQNELMFGKLDKKEEEITKGKFRKILRENMRELKYCENIGLNKYMKTPKNAFEIKDFLKKLKTHLKEKGFGNFYLEYHFGKKGEDHVQILSNSKEKEREIVQEIVKYLTHKEEKKEVIKEFKNEVLERILKKLETLSEQTQQFSNTLNSINERYSFKEEPQHRDLKEIHSILEGIERKYHEKKSH